jgi:A/G-specific adenine glycosylase
MRPDDASVRLLQWFDAEKRDFPWRQKREPYLVWLSEVMLQQTRAVTVVPYFERFVESFPSLDALAAAQPEEVLAHWSGLGYYHRARRLHRAARTIVAVGGRLPSTAAELQKLPGIGAYTAAAIASIAFGEAVPVLDGNVSRVVARRLALCGDPRRAAQRRKLERAAADLLHRERPGDSNEAMMELGAVVCTPRRPRCSSCPLHRGCRAAAQGEATRYPQAAPGRQTERRQRAVALVRQAGRVLLFRRPQDAGVLAGMWELPWAEPGEEGAPEDGLAARYGGRWSVASPVGRVRHQISARAFEIEILPARLEVGEWAAEGPEAGWFTRAQLASLATSSLVRKFLARADRERRRA